MILCRFGTRYSTFETLDCIVQYNTIRHIQCTTVIINVEHRLGFEIPTVITYHTHLGRVGIMLWIFGRSFSVRTESLCICLMGLHRPLSISFFTMQINFFKLSLQSNVYHYNKIPTQWFWASYLWFFYITFVISVSFRTSTALNEVYMYDTIYHPWELPLAPALQNTA